MRIMMYENQERSRFARAFDALFGKDLKVFEDLTGQVEGLLATKLSLEDIVTQLQATVAQQQQQLKREQVEAHLAISEQLQAAQEQTGQLLQTAQEQSAKLQEQQIAATREHTERMAMLDANYQATLEQHESKMQELRREHHELLTSNAYLRANIDEFKAQHGIAVDLDQQAKAELDDFLQRLEAAVLRFITPYFSVSNQVVHLQPTKKDDDLFKCCFKFLAEYQNKYGVNRRVQASILVCNLLIRDPYRKIGTNYSQATSKTINLLEIHNEIHSQSYKVNTYYTRYYDFLYHDSEKPSS